MATEVGQSGRESGSDVFLGWLVEAVGAETVVTVVQSGDAPTPEAGSR